MHNTMNVSCRCGFLIVLCIISWACVGVVRSAPAAGLSEGQPAPAFSLEDAEGRLHDLGRSQASLLILYFCDLESKPNREGLAWIDRFAADYRANQLQVWAISVSSRERALQTGSQLKLAIPILPDTRGVSELYDAHAVLPVLYVIEKGKGVLRVLTGTGKSTQERLRQVVEARLDDIRRAMDQEFEDLKTRGIQAYEDRRLEAASRDLEKALSIRTDRECYRYLAYAWLNLKQDARVEETLDAAMKVYPGDPQFHAVYVDFYLERNDPQRAKGALDRGLARFPRDPDLLQLEKEVNQALRGAAAATRTRTLPESPIKKTVESSEQKARSLYNLARQENQNLSWDPCLARKALQRAELLVRKGTFDHKDPTTGKNPSWELVKTCHKAAYAGENLSRGEGQASRAIHAAFMQSNSHRKNILDKRFTLMGVGCHEHICVELFAGL